MTTAAHARETVDIPREVLSLSPRGGDSDRRRRTLILTEIPNGVELCAWINATLKAISASHPIDRFDALFPCNFNRLSI